MQQVRQVRLGVSIPAVRVRYIFAWVQNPASGYCFNSRSAGKIHSKIEQQTANVNAVSIPAVRVRYIADEKAKELLEYTFQFPQCG